MSNQENGFQGSVPFIQDKEFQNMSLDQIRHIIKQEEEALKKDYNELGERKRLIKRFKRLQKARDKVRQGIDIKKEYKKKKEKKRVKTFEEYFQECIKNKEIPPDTPLYFRKALERAIIEHEDGIVREKSSLENFANKYVIKGEEGLAPFQYFFKIKNKLRSFSSFHRNIKFKTVLVCLVELQIIDKYGIKGFETEKGYFKSNTHINIESTDVNELVDKFTNENTEQLENYLEKGSDWYFKEVVQFEIHTIEFNPSNGSSYIKLPDWITNKKAILNIKNSDNKCFIWCVLRYLYPKESHDERITDLKKYENELITKGITFPMNVKDISKFEKLNPKIPGINVFSVDEKNVFYPLRMAQRDCIKTIDLFLYEKDGNSHYTLIKHFNRFIRSQKTRTKTKDGKIYICKRCFSHFTKPDLLQKHIKYCSSNGVVSVKMPEKGSMLYFKNYYKQLPLPFVVYADFECFTSPLNTCSPNPDKPYGNNYQKHEPSGFCYYLKGIVDSFVPVTFTKKSDSDDVALTFLNNILELTKSIYDKYYRHPRQLILTRKEQESFNKAISCHICNKPLNGDSVRDHCHFTGKYRGAAHNKCNLMCKKPRILPVIFHNLQGYDAHLFIKQIARLKGKLNCIPSTEEKYISFSKSIKVGEYYCLKLGKMCPINFEIRFLDSFKFLQTSLANLVSNLSKEDFHNTKHVFKKNVDLLTRKGVYPYDYVSSLDKLSETQLPPKEEFYSQLYDEDISDDDYQHAIKVWNTFECKTIRDYHNLYLKSDVLLLADVFENFRKTCLKHYKLDPAHYYTSPGLAWDACLKETGQHLQLLHDYDMLMMFERGIRGGITHISKRYAEANNKYMKNYNPDKPSSYIQYLDANNLYGWAMSQNLPTHGFKWISNITKQEVLDIVDGANHSMSNHGKKGWIFEVDLEYPSKLWESHNDYPIAPENIKVNGVEKLVCHFKPRKNYVVHYRNLRQYLEMGMKITAVHRGISFYQSSWMEPYIRKNTELRKCAKNM